MTPRRTLALIALFLAITLGSFVLYLVRATSAPPEGTTGRLIAPSAFETAALPPLSEARA